MTLKRHALTHPRTYTLLTAAATALVACTGAIAGAAWDDMDKAEKELRDVTAELRLCNKAIALCRDGIAAKNGETKAARRAMEEAEAALDAVLNGGDLGEITRKTKNARAARDEKTESLFAGFAPFRAAKEKHAALTNRIEAMTARIATLDADELLELARLHEDEREVGGKISSAIRGSWMRGEVTELFNAADTLVSENGKLVGASEAAKQAKERVNVARKTLNDAIAALPLDEKAGKALLARQAEIQGRETGLKARIGEMENALLKAGKTVSAVTRVYDGRQKKEVDHGIQLWLPPNHAYIRGVIVAHSMIGGLASSRPTRLAAAREGLGMMVCGVLKGDSKEALDQIDAMLEQFAAASGHPELKGAPLMLGGLSASVISTRGVACVAPERVFGIVHVAGGNMHHTPDGCRGMVEVPFIAFNGEFEWCGPEGGGHSSGKAGIRKEYGKQTQWVMIREQMLRLWRDKHRHRMTLVVVPCRDHGAWDLDLTALFIRKCAQYRLPVEKRDGGKPAICRPLPADKGWLTDADLDHPKFDPAPYDSFKGDKNNAFWQFDEEMARAVCAYHKDQFILPDPTKANPVPADWPPVKK
jgi:hypothetical protein